MAPQLELVFDLLAYMDKTALTLGSIKNGPHRVVGPLTGGYLRGVPGSRGEGADFKILGGGSDWLLFDPETKIANLDVRTHGTTPDGQSVFIYYHGHLKMDDIGDAYMKLDQPAPPTSAPGDHYWFTSPRLEISDPKFKWAETTLFVGQGYWYSDDTGRGVAYKIYAVSN